SRAGAYVGDALLREIVDEQVFDVDLQRRKDVDAAKAGPGAGVRTVDADALEAHDSQRVVGRGVGGIDDNAVSARDQHGPEGAAAIDGDRLGNRHCAEPAGIEAIDLAVDGGFRNRAGKGLAGCGATAGIDV